jgi:hypothetical protein
MNMAHSWSQV